jgi:hypothetical protein
MTVTNIAKLISNHLYPGFTASVTYGGTVYLIAGFERLRQLSDDELQMIAPEAWPALLELGRGTAREGMYSRGAIAERQELQSLLKGEGK